MRLQSSRDNPSQLNLTALHALVQTGDEATKSRCTCCWRRKLEVGKRVCTWTNRREDTYSGEWRLESD
uniref:Uncharacterized protein n=1 Tax=Hyaloperonospora arabidopsidis (strain Emoy2) TaxID=559515 RepID=M4C1A3_HYAAE